MDFTPFLAFLSKFFICIDNPAMPASIFLHFLTDSIIRYNPSENIAAAIIIKIIPNK